MAYWITFARERRRLVMEERVNLAQANFKAYCESFNELTDQQQKNFTIKFEHSIRVASICNSIALKLGWTEEERGIACIAGIFHDIGRFKQLVEFDTFNDTKSVDHAEYSVQVIEENKFLVGLTDEQQTVILEAIRYHNKRELPRDLPQDTLQYAKLLRDADKLDILKVITDYYSNPKATPNHTLTWELPKGSTVTPVVAKQAMAGNLVAKNDVANLLDIKIMQLSWVFDLNFKPSFQLLMDNRFLEKIYASLTKSDTIIQIYRMVKVFAENKILADAKSY